MILSHPTWVRGLKQDFASLTQAKLNVAPHVGAWIETIANLLSANIEDVAPHVGAWIETKILL